MAKSKKAAKRSAKPETVKSAALAPAFDPDRVPQQTFADLCAVSRRAVQEWRDCPRNRDKTYGLFAALPWYCKQLRSRIPNEDTKLADLEKQKLENQIRMQEFKIETLTHNAVPRAVLERAVSARDESAREWCDQGYKGRAIQAAKALGLTGQREVDFMKMVEGLMRQLYNCWMADGAGIDAFAKEPK